MEASMGLVKAMVTGWWYTKLRVILPLQKTLQVPHDMQDSIAVLRLATFRSHLRSRADLNSSKI